MDTDAYYMQVTFPALCLLPPGTDLHLTPGTPIAQVIPFRRDAWKASMGQVDPAAAEAQRQAIKQNVHLYRDQHWQKKSYT